MAKKSKRIVAPRILHVMNENGGIGMRFIEIFKALAEAGWFHNQNPMSSNLKWLIEQGKIVHIGNQYALIQTRKNGSKFAIVKDPVETVVELESD